MAVRTQISGLTQDERRAVLRNTKTSTDLAGLKMEWAGAWFPGVYDYNDVVTDDGWLMICRNEPECTDKPAPYPTGNPFYIYTGNSPEIQNTAKTITFGNRYTFDAAGYMTAYRIYTVAGNRYSAYLVSDPDGTGQVTELLTFTGNGGWEEFGLNSIAISPGTVFELACVCQEPDGIPDTFSGNWNYLTPPNTVVPASGQIVHANEQPDVFRVSATDFDGGDRYAELAGIEIGDTINGPNVSWAVQAVQDNTTWFSFIVAPAQQDGPDGVLNFVFETVSPSPITNMQDPGYWPTTPYTVQGFLGVDGGPLAYSDTAYGTDIKVQGASISDEWEALAAPSGTSGGGGGVSDHNDLTGVTPNQHHDQLHDLDSHTDVNTADRSGLQVLTWSDLDQEWQARTPTASLGLVAFAYRFDTALDNVPASGRIQFDNADPSLVTTLYINENDVGNEDISLFMQYLIPGSWCNVGDRTDYSAQHHSYDVVNAAVEVTPGVWAVDVTVFENVGGPFNNNEQINLVIRYTNAQPELSHDELTGVTADQHHPKLHAHFGDGSGDVQHGVLQGIGANDHHAEVHSIFLHVDVQDAVYSDGQFLSWDSTGGQFVPVDPPSGVPAGGLPGQLIRKNTVTDGDVSWDYQVVEGDVNSPPNLETGQLLWDPNMSPSYGDALTVTPWETMPLENGWTTEDGLATFEDPARWRRFGDMIQLSGTVKQGTSNIIAYLPTKWFFDGRTQNMPASVTYGAGAVMGTVQASSVGLNGAINTNSNPIPDSVNLTNCWFSLTTNIGDTPNLGWRA